MFEKEPYYQEAYLRLNQIIGQTEVTKAEAERNRKLAEAEIKAGKKPNRRPKRFRKPITPLIPISRSSWLQGVKEGRFPKPVKLGPNTTVWRKDSIMQLIRKST